MSATAPDRASFSDVQITELLGLLAGSDSVELAFQTAAETRAFLASRGIDLTGEQETKTRRALEYFATALHAGDPEPV